MSNEDNDLDFYDKIKVGLVGLGILFALAMVAKYY